MAKSARLLLLTAFFFSLNTSVVFAAIPPLHPDICSKGASTGPPPVTTTLTLSEKDKAKNQSFLTQINACPNACLDLIITLAVEPSVLSNHTMVVTTKAVDKCNPQTEENLEKSNRGCFKGQTQPRLTIDMKEVVHPIKKSIEIEARTISSKSRCDKMISSIVNSMFQKTSLEPKDITAALEKIGNRPAQVSGLTDPRITDILQDAFGSTFPTEAIKDIADSDAAERIAELAEAEKYEEAAQVAQAQGLNKETVEAISKLEKPEHPDTEFSSGPVGGPRPPTSQITGLNENTSPEPLPGGRYGEVFRSAEDEFRLKTPGYLAGLAKLESSGNPNVCAGSSSACGLFQYTEGTWRIDSARINGGVPLPSSYRFNPEIAARVTAASVAYYDQKYGSLIDQSGMDKKAAYFAFHNLGEGGGQRFVQAFAANPAGNTPVYAVLTATEIRNNPKLYGNGSISLAQAQANMLAGMGGSTAFVGGAPRGFVTGDSPFANVSPFFGLFGADSVNQVSPDTITAPVGVAGPGTTPGSMAPSLGGSGGGGSVQQGSQNSSSLGSPAQQLLDALFPKSPTAPGEPVEAVASIVVQPQEVTRGEAMVLSWSSVGTSSSAPCQMLLTVGTSTSVIAQGNEGTRNIDTIAALPGTWNFELRCTAILDGELIERATSATVK